MREECRFEWEATVERVKKQGKALCFSAPVQTEAELNPILSPAARDKLLRLFPMAERYVYPFVSGGTLFRRERRDCLWLPGCPDLFLRNRILLAAEGELNGPEREQWGKAYCGLVPAKQEEPLVVVGQRYRKGSGTPVRMFREPVAVGELAIAAGGNPLLQYGLLSSRMFRVWAGALGGRTKACTLYQYIYNAFPVPKADRALLENIESAAAALEESGNRAQRRRDLDEWTDKLYGGPFASDEERLNRLAALFLSKKRPARTGSREKTDAAGAEAPGTCLTHAG